ncbi:MAG TPA: hypothetical protein PKH77_02225 [Anaerolineae bacterium]|nr:hypothetical protein [Anaerolineae bacterium]
MTEFPPAGFVPTPSAIPGIEVYMPAPVEATAQPEVAEFKCPQCQATTAYSVSDGGLRCSHCGYYEPPPKSIVGKGAEEFEFTVATMEVAAARGWGEARKEIACQNCSARTTLPAGELTHTCPFCGSNRVVQQDAPQDNLRPRFLIPFQITDAVCTQYVRAWLGSSWMTPKSLRDLASMARFSAIYVPFWTLDALTEADWKAEVGHQKTESYRDSKGNRHTRTVTVWRWESGHAQRVFDDLLVSGTTRLSNVLLKRLKDYRTAQLTPYDPKYLAGLMAQAYDVPLQAAWAAGREEMRAQTRETCRGQASTSQIRNFSMSLNFQDESWRYILAPLYVSTYKYEDATYQVMVNGQTGTVAGQRPVDWPKVWLAIAAMVAPGVLLGLLGLLLLVGVPPAGPIVLIVALVALVAGGAFAVGTYGKAKEMGDV